MAHPILINPDVSWAQEGDKLKGTEKWNRSERIAFPSWGDQNLIREGQEFVRRNFFSVIFAHLISLLFLLCYAPIRTVLILTGKSHSSEKSKIRYFWTLVHVKTWYEGDLSPSSKTVKDIYKIRQIHSGVGERLYSNVHYNEKKECALPDCDCETILDEKQKIIKAMQKDVGTDENNNEDFGFDPLSSTQRSFLITQLDMAVTQFCFFGFLTLFPVELGLQNEKRGIKGFLHLWAVIGHYLGILPEYNLALPENQGRREFVWKQLLLPNFRDCHPNTIKLWVWLVEGVSQMILLLRLESLLLFTVHRILKVPEKRCKLWRQLNFSQLVCFHLMQQCFSSWILTPSLRTLFNNLLRLAIWMFQFKLKWNIP